jgi:hypothetical protein
MPEALSFTELKSHLLAGRLCPGGFAWKYKKSCLLPKKIFAMLYQFFTLSYGRI